MRPDQWVLAGLLVVLLLAGTRVGVEILLYVKSLFTKK